MNILLTGAAGFIGSALCKQLVESGHNVTAVDNFSNYYDVSFKQLRVRELLNPLNLEVLNLDICDKPSIDNLIKSRNPGAVINLAAQAGVRLSVSESGKYVESNLVGFSNILVSTIENKVPIFLYASSSSVYGDLAKVPYSELETNLRPTSFYGSTKLANELLTPTLVKNSATKARSLRFFTVYGPWGRPDMAYFRMIANVIAGTEFDFFGDGTIERDFTFIDDAVRSVINLMSELEEKSPGFSDVVNLGGGRPLSMNYLMEVVGSLTGKKVSFERFETNLNDARKTMSDASYIQNLIGSKPSTKLEDGISKTIEWASSKKISVNLDKWVKSVR
jgi:UDP-glucuronate 4-epimerase